MTVPQPSFKERAAAALSDGALKIAIDRTTGTAERKRAADELQARAEDLARSNEELEHFAYVASHDLQEPLRTVASFAQLLARRFNDSEQDAREFVGHITSEVQRMRSLIEGLLAYSRVARTEHPATIVNMNRLLDDALSALRIAIADSGATITRDPLPNLVVGAQQITQLLQNLLEVRGIGLLDIRAIFGETAVRRKMRLKLIVHLVRKETLERDYERLPYEPLTQDVLGVPVLKVVIQVVAGRNIAVLVEAAVRNTILQLRGIDTYQEFVDRHRRAMERDSGG